MRCEFMWTSTSEGMTLPLFGLFLPSNTHTPLRTRRLCFFGFEQKTKAKFSFVQYLQYRLSAIYTTNNIHCLLGITPLTMHWPTTQTQVVWYYRTSVCVCESILLEEYNNWTKFKNKIFLYTMALKTVHKIYTQNIQVYIVHSFTTNFIW